MTVPRRVVAGLITIAAIGAGAPVAVAQETAAGASAQAAAANGRYIGYAQYASDKARYHRSKVVLFFHAKWCPTCKAADKSLRKDGVPRGLVVVQVDYDSAKSLRKQYKVTVQHTFVQITRSGKAVKKWTGSRTGKEIAKQAR